MTDPRAFIQTMIALASASFGLVAALAWNEAIKATLAKLGLSDDLAGLYAYGQSAMKTREHYFLGFPSYWNVVALYLFWLRPGPAAAVACVVVPAALTFVPTRYLYPSRNGAFWRTNFVLGTAWVALVCWMLLQPAPTPALVWLSLGYPALYMALSFLVEYRLRAGQWNGR